MATPKKLRLGFLFNVFKLGIMRGTTNEWLTKRGFQLHLLENGASTNIKDRLNFFDADGKQTFSPPLVDLFIGCSYISSVEKNETSLGAIGSLEIFFDQKDYPRMETVNAISNRDFYSYYTTYEGEDSPSLLGFSQGQSIIA